MSFAGGQITWIVIGSILFIAFGSMSVARFVHNRQTDTWRKEWRWLALWAILALAVMTMFGCFSAVSRSHNQTAARDLSSLGFIVLGVDAGITNEDQYATIEGPHHCIVDYPIKHFRSGWRVVKNDFVRYPDTITCDD